MADITDMIKELRALTIPSVDEILDRYPELAAGDADDNTSAPDDV